MSWALAAVVLTLCTMPVSESTPMCTFIPKRHWFPFLVWCISGSRSPDQFLADGGGAMMAASTMAPSRNFSPWDSRRPLISSSKLSPKPWRSNR